MRLEPTATVRAWQLAATALPLIGGVAVVLLLGRFRLRRTILPFTLHRDHARCSGLLNDASFLGGVRPFDCGDDGLVYDGYARVMLQQLAGRRYQGALDGLKACSTSRPACATCARSSTLIFGESYLGYLAADAAAADAGLRCVQALPAAALGAGAGADLRRRADRRRCSARACCNTSNGRRAASAIRPPMWPFSPRFVLLLGPAPPTCAIALRRPAGGRPVVRAGDVRAAESRAVDRHPARRRRPCGAVAARNFAASPGCASALFRCSAWRCTTGSTAAQLVLFTDHQRHLRSRCRHATYRRSRQRN